MPLSFGYGHCGGTHRELCTSVRTVIGTDTKTLCLFVFSCVHACTVFLSQTMPASCVSIVLLRGVCAANGTPTQKHFMCVRACTCMHAWLPATCRSNTPKMQMPD